MNPHGPHGGHGHGAHGPHHYQPYPDLSSPSPVPHSPAPDTSPFNGHPGSGGGGGNNNNNNNNSQGGHQHHLDGHHGGHMGPGHHHNHHHHHHHLNNNNNSTANNNKNGSSGHACAGCGGKILERYLLHALDRYWHHSCLKCTCCGGQLADLGTSCFTKANMILCKADYARLFGNTGACSACGQTIPASEFVMRVGGGPMPMGPGGPPSTPNAPSPLHVFHLKCFSCSKCGSQLVPGDRYHLLGGALVCEQDWHKLMKGGAAPGVPAGPGAATGVRKGKVGRPRRSRD